MTRAARGCCCCQSLPPSLWRMHFAPEKLPTSAWIVPMLREYFSGSRCCVDPTPDSILISAEMHDYKTRLAFCSQSTLAPDRRTISPHLTRSFLTNSTNCSGEPEAQVCPVAASLSRSNAHARCIPAFNCATIGLGTPAGAIIAVHVVIS